MPENNLIIWLIDDSKASNFLHEKKLARNFTSAKFESFQKVEKAVNKIISIVEEQDLPDLILLDINMPAMDGWDFLNEVSTHLEYRIRSMSIVMLTTSLNPDDEQRSKESGLIASFIQKPLDQTKINQIIDLLK